MRTLAALLVMTIVAALVACGGAVEPSESAARESTATSTVPDQGAAQRALAPTDAPPVPQIRCAIPDGRTIACSSNGVGLPEGVSGIEDEHSFEQCAAASFVAPYKGHCATGTPCEVVIANYETGYPDYLDGVCE